MIQRIRCAASRLWPLLLLGLSLGGRPAWAQSPMPLHQAVAEGRVTVSAVASPEFGQLSLTLGPSGDAVMVTVSPGTRFVPNDPALSPLVNTERVELLVQDQVTINPLRVISLTPDLGLPLPTHTTAYQVDGLAASPVPELLDRAATDDLAAAPALQLAVWAAASGRSPADVSDGLNAPYGAADVATAQALLAGLPLPTPETTPLGEGPTTIAPTPDGEDNAIQTSGSNLPRAILLGGLGLLLLAAAIAGAAAAGQRRKPAANSAPKEAVRAPRSITNGNRNHPPRGERPPTEVLGRVGLTLVGDEGQTFTVTEDTVIARSPIAVLELPLTGIYSPHVCLYWSATGIEVKDLNSAGGAELDGRPLGHDFTVARVGSWLRLAGTITAELRADAIVVNGTRYPAPPGNVILSRKPLTVHALGEADRSVSDPHCVILREGGQFVIRDLNSRNGVHLNDAPIGPANEVIPDGATLRLGLATSFTCSFGQDV